MIRGFKQLIQCCEKDLLVYTSQKNFSDVLLVKDDPEQLTTPGLYINSDYLELHYSKTSYRFEEDSKLGLLSYFGNVLLGGRLVMHLRFHQFLDLCKKLDEKSAEKELQTRLIIENFQDLYTAVFFNLDDIQDPKDCVLAVAVLRKPLKQALASKDQTISTLKSGSTSLGGSTSLSGSTSFSGRTSQSVRLSESGKTYSGQSQDKDERSCMNLVESVKFYYFSSQKSIQLEKIQAYLKRTILTLPLLSRRDKGLQGPFYFDLKALKDLADSKPRERLLDFDTLNHFVFLIKVKNQSNLILSQVLCLQFQDDCEEDQEEQKQPQTIIKGYFSIKAVNQMKLLEEQFLIEQMRRLLVCKFCKKKIQGKNVNLLRSKKQPILLDLQKNLVDEIVFISPKNDRMRKRLDNYFKAK